MTRSYLDTLMANIDDAIASATGDGGIDADSADARLLLDVIGHQRHVIAALVSAVQELRADVNRLNAAGAAVIADSNDVETYFRGQR